MGGINALEARRRILLNTPHIETASGSIATFQTDMVGKLKECKIYFEPIQEGEGDPSPDNVRPITGWTGCEVTVSPTTQSSDGTTIPIDWTDEAGTVYGGYVDLVKSEVVATIGYANLGSLGWTIVMEAWGLIRTVEMYKYNNSIMCTNYPYATPTSFETMQDKAVRNHGWWFYVKDSSLAGLTQAEIKTQLDGVGIVYPLATSIHYPIDPITLKTLRGTNNIFANTNGKTEVKFYTH